MMLQFFTPGQRCDASPLPASLGGKGFMVDRMSARQSATSLFGAQARAGVCPTEVRKRNETKEMKPSQRCMVIGSFLLVLNE